MAFITFEGIDGVGKSTQLRLLAARLIAAGHAVVQTREPGGSPGAEEIRTLLVSGAPGRWSAAAEMLLFTAARRDHIDCTVRPALAAGQVVLCDRYVDSTRAYQGVQGQRSQTDRIHDLMIGLDPDLTLIFDMDPATALARARARSGSEDRFERRGLSFQEDLRAAFRGIAQAEPGRCVMIDATEPEAAVSAAVWDVVTAKLGRV